MNEQKKNERNNCIHFVSCWITDFNDIDALSLNGAFHFPVQSFPPLPPPLNILLCLLETVLLPHTVVESPCLMCVHINMNLSVIAIVCTKICCVRCTDLINRYCRVLFKDR